MAKFKIETEIESLYNIGDIVMFDPTIKSKNEYDELYKDVMYVNRVGIGVIIGVGLNRNTNEITYDILSPSFATSIIQYNNMYDYNIIYFITNEEAKTMFKRADDCMLGPEEVDKLQYGELYKANETAQRVNAI